MRFPNESCLNISAIIAGNVESMFNTLPKGADVFHITFYISLRGFGYRHPGPQCLWKGGSEQHFMTPLTGSDGISGIRTWMSAS